MQQHYEDLWRRLPAQLHPPELERRRGFLVGELRGGERLLDLGCGDGELTAVAAAAGARATGAEVAETALARARRAHPQLRFELIGLDGPLPWADGSFDVVWCSEVIEHVADTEPWLAEVHRVLAPGGRLLLTTPSHGRLRLLLGGIERYSEPLGDHLHLYTARSLRELLRAFGFGQTRVWAASGPPTLRRTLFARAIR